MFCVKVLLLARGFNRDHSLCWHHHLRLGNCQRVAGDGNAVLLPSPATSLGGVAKQVFTLQVLSIPSDEDEHGFVLMQHRAWFD